MPVVVVAVIAVVSALVLVAAITLAVFYCCWRKHRSKQEGFLEMSDGKALSANQKPEVDPSAASRRVPVLLKFMACMMQGQSALGKGWGR